MIYNPCEWGASTFIIFSENVGQLVYYTHIFPLVISLFIGFFVLINNYRALENRVFFFMTLMFSIWVYFDLILWASPSPQDVMFFWASIVPIEMLMYLSALYLVYLFSTNKVDAPTWMKVLASFTMLPIVLLMHTDLNVVGLSPDCDEGAIEGPVISYMYYAELIIILIAAGFLAKGLKTITSEIDRQKLKIIGFATILFLLFFSAGNLTLLFDLGPFYEQYKLFGMPIFAAFVSYAFLRYRAFGAKSLLTEILVTILVILVFSTLLFESMDTARPILLITLLITAVLGTQLVVSVRNEVKQREELQDLTKKLASANKRLKVLDQMKSEFVSIASHQLRSPLTSIRGYTSMLLEGSFGKLPQKAQEAVSRISESSRLMASSVEDYLNVSRIESGNMKYEKEDFNLRDEVEHVVDDLRQYAMKKGLLLTFKSTNLDRKGIVNADKGKVHQILHNLIDNAMKYTPKGSIAVEVYDTARPKKIYVSIADTGIGMSKETLQAVFEKFERAHNANSVNVSGTGLGLYVARKMAQDMDGDITATSPGEGEGSTLVLELPIKL